MMFLAQVVTIVKEVSVVKD